MRRAPWQPDEDPPRETRPRGWEWPGLAELVAGLLFCLVLLGAAAGMALRLLNPRRRVRELSDAVTRAATQAARQAVPPPGEADLSATPPGSR
ncbi:MAG: hypothetical protein HY904_17725 [Deltaproteobacteria bacterium]|nr:hypothetical protein [Deltaproteobacteria bacterium]